jgi:hypothetical protein
MKQEELDETITAYDQYLQRMSAAAEHFCEDLVASNYQEISGVLPALVEGLAWIHEALENFVKLKYLPEEVLKAFRDFLANLYEALQNKDYVLLHDLCEFELPPLLAQIHVAGAQIN